MNLYVISSRSYKFSEINNVFNLPMCAMGLGLNEIVLTGSSPKNIWSRAIQTGN
jgi:hypothetical protein